MCLSKVSRLLQRCGFFSGADGVLRRSCSCWWVLLRVLRSVLHRHVAPLQARLHGVFPLSWSLPCVFLQLRIRQLHPVVRMVFAWATAVLCIVMDSLALLLVRCCRLLVVLLDFLIWSGLFPVARASDPENVPYIDADLGASCAGRRWRVCIARHVWSAPLCDTRLSHILVPRAGLRRRLCVWRSLTLRAGSRVESVAS